MRTPLICSFFFALFLILSSIAAQSDHFPATENLSTTWTNDISSINFTNFTDGSKIRTILLIRKDRNSPIFTCGFFCNGTCTSYLFAIVVNLPIPDDLYGEFRDTPEVIWSANRDHPVRNGAILNLTAAGDLVLQDVDGSIVWTTNTTGKSVAAMNLANHGNLALLTADNSSVWQSFDNPTDCLLPGQQLFVGQKLTTIWTEDDQLKDSYSLQVTDQGLFASVESTPPQVYYRYLVKDIINQGKDEMISDYLVLTPTSLKLYITSASVPTGISLRLVDLLQTYTLQYLKLMPDGHLKIVGWDASGKGAVTDVLGGYLGDCSYPLACGRNAICSANQQCSCPGGTDSFTAVKGFRPNNGCFPVTPLTCNDTRHQHFIKLENITYFTYTSDMENVDMETCKQACLNNCSCKAAIFNYNYGSNPSNGSCALPSELFTMSVDASVLPKNASAFVKVQNVTSTPSPPVSQSQGQVITRKRNQVVTILGSTIGSFVLVLVVVLGFTNYIFRHKKKGNETEEDSLNQVPGMPTRFSYEELNTATQNFSKKLGQGGFGSVFQGTLEDGSHIAVKCLQGHLHVKKSFMAEVESIGSIHHVNLVRLKGFSSWKSERLLVYEFMSNGSLDQWIYPGDRKHLLSWQCRKKIILDIAKGLAYLHEECRQKIIHFDIKPQNILLDEDFNAKVSDFGLSKLIDRNQSSQVVSTMRGTFGYMAPECATSIITEKIDVYSFGIVLLEILCGRKNFDRSQPEESWHLLRVFQSCWEQGTLLSIVDRYSEDMQVHCTDVTEMMKLASWCLQSDLNRRPSMSTVIKVLEGVMNVESNLVYNFNDPRVPITTIEHQNSSKPMLPFILSGPRS